MNVLEPCTVCIDYYERDPDRAELGRDVVTRGANATDDDVLAQGSNRALHTSTPQNSLQIPFHNQGRQARNEVEQRPAAKDDQSYRHGPSLG